MSKKIVVITGSPRKNGNSNTLAEAFIKGAEEKGHTVVRFDSAFKNIHPCIACDKCRTNGGSCVFDDDFNTVKDDIINADMIVFATPIYYFAMSAQIRTAIDRFYSIDDKISKPKKTALIAALADSSKGTVEPTIAHYKAMTRYLGWSDVAQIIAYGVWPEGAVNNTPYVKQAYELGKNL